MTTNLNEHDNEILINSFANSGLESFGQKEARTVNNV